MDYIASKDTNAIPTILSTLVEEDNSASSSTEINPDFLSSSARFDKRKSSPAILGLPFGLNHEEQLSLHLSQQRNSIEAALLLASFNKSIAKVNDKGQQHWQDDMSIPSQNKNKLNNETRRYSHDINMNWQTMPESFLNRPDLLNTKYRQSKVSWSHDPSPPMIQSTTVLHPLARPPPPNYHSYMFPPPQPIQPQQPRYYYYPISQKVPIPQQSPEAAFKPKRKKQRINENEEQVAKDESEYPDMSFRDIEAARQDPEARPRKQKLRFIGDEYTPNWVRYNGQSKEGLCDTCQPGKWLQLKNSAYWYHKQFFHGISSVSGKEFIQPMETRWVDQDLVEGLCHQCHTWVAVSNVKRKNSVLWYRHAHKCHVYIKPKHAGNKKK